MKKHKLEDLVISYANPGQTRKPTLSSSKKKLPALSHNVSYLKLISLKKPVLDQTLTVYKKENSIAKKKYLKLKKISCNQDEFERLDFLSNNNQIIRNKSINIQQKLIELKSGVKLQSISKTKLAKLHDSRMSSHIDSILEKYELDLKEKLKELENNSFKV